MREASKPTSRPFIDEACRRLRSSRADVLYLHLSEDGHPACALVTIEWLNRQDGARDAFYAALDRWPEANNHSHLTGDDE